jgi:hypothetical protein
MHFSIQDRIGMFELENISFAQTTNVVLLIFDILGDFLVVGFRWWALHAALSGKLGRCSSRLTRHLTQQIANRVGIGKKKEFMIERIQGTGRG